MEPYIDPTFKEKALIQNDYTSGDAMEKMCKAVINDEKGQCDLTEFHKVDFTKPLEKDENYLKNSEMMDEVCDAVDKGGFAVFGVAAETIGQWPMDFSTLKVNPADTISGVSQEALAKCEVRCQYPSHSSDGRPLLALVAFVGMH